MSERLDDELLARYLAGETDPGDRAVVEAWAAANPGHVGELRRLQSAWSMRPLAGSWDVDGAWARVGARIDAEPAPARRAWIRYAAAAAVLIAAAGVLAKTDPAPAAYETSVGEQREITLADGSQVILAPDSRVAVRRGFGQWTREVELRGRAWFNVRHDETRPFQVHSAGMVVEDLGTEFEVFAPPDAGPLQVAVITGAVAVRPSGTTSSDAILLRPGDVARIPRRGEPSVRHETPVESLAGWRAGTLGFDDAPLTEILAELSRWYGIRFQLTDPALGERRFTATMPTADLAEALATLGPGLQLEASRAGDVVTLSPRTSW